LVSSLPAQLKLRPFKTMRMKGEAEAAEYLSG